MLTTVTTGRIEVSTFKEGLLSPLAHDLRLRVERFEIEHDGESVTARFWPASFVVEGVMREGRLDAGALGAAQKAEIAGNIRDRILHSDAHPTIVWSGRASASNGGHRLGGTLEMCGRREPLDLDVSESEGRFRGAVELRPSRWGIAPFRAMLGTIRLQDRVMVRFDVPARDPAEQR